MNPEWSMCSHEYNQSINYNIQSINLHFSTFHIHIHPLQSTINRHSPPHITTMPSTQSSPSSNTSGSPISLLQQHRPAALAPTKPSSSCASQINTLEQHERAAHKARGGLYASVHVQERSKSSDSESRRVLLTDTIRGNLADKQVHLVRVPLPSLETVPSHLFHPLHLVSTISTSSLWLMRRIFRSKPSAPPSTRTRLSTGSSLQQMGQSVP